MRRPHSLWLSVLPALLVLSPAAAHAAREVRLEVFAAASLTEAFDALADRFEQTHPGVRVQVQYGGSQALVAQIEQGAKADILATADDRWMDHARARGLIAGDPVTFAHNSLVVIVPRANPGRIGGLRDLARPGVKLLVGAEAVPVGAYTRAALRRMSDERAYGPEYGPRVLRNVVSQEENVKQIVGKVELGEADAGFVYRSDVTPSALRLVRELEIPAALNAPANDPIAVVARSEHAALARDFVALVRSREGQAALAERRFTPVAP